MKKALLIIGGLAMLLVASTVGIAWYAISKSEDEKNSERTKPARDARAAKLAEKKVNETQDESKQETEVAV